MHTKHVYNNYSPILLWKDVTTAVYIPSFLLFLHSNNQLLTGNCFDDYYTILFFAGAEVIKFIIHASQDRSLIGKNTAKEFFRSILVLSTIFIVIYVVAVLFGAPVFSNFQETAFFASITTAVTALPACMYLGADTTINMFLSLTSYEADNVHKLFMLKIRLALCGAWLGAFVIPLDWNRPWQEWPIPCCVGTLLGYTVANFITLFLQVRTHGKSSKKTGKYTL